LKKKKKKNFFFSKKKKIIKKGERKNLVVNINTYSLETLIQDPNSYIPGSSESLLNNMISQIDVIYLFCVI